MDGASWVLAYDIRGRPPRPRETLPSHSPDAQLHLVLLSQRQAEAQAGRLLLGRSHPFNQRVVLVREIYGELERPPERMQERRSGGRVHGRGRGGGLYRCGPHFKLLNSNLCNQTRKKHKLR